MRGTGGKVADVRGRGVVCVWEGEGRNDERKMQVQGGSNIRGASGKDQNMAIGGILLRLVVFALVFCSTLATHGSISSDLFEDDIKDMPHAEADSLPEASSDVMSARFRNPCYTKECYRGEMCIVDDKEQAQCVCNTDCSYYAEEPRYQVCSNTNHTYLSECDLDKDHCLCKHKLPGCSQPGVDKIYLDYYSSCREPLPCSEHSAQQFPLRMRNWMFVIMEAMAQRAGLGEYQEMVTEAAQNERHAHAVIWKFCDLDSDPQDRHVSKRELQYTVRSLRALEGCLLPFLDSCDQDENRVITLQEWGQCLGLQHSEITDRCVAIHRHKAETSEREQ
ncbi:sparc protein [Plakobranchus ocellatus]|uniref:Sparc protein n=1 Tax=Plakobranchus ocellatus TaxID=259542 RepID=A0AAV4BJR5_9GAST|nr:sparc protein [Plakobranchus ocellatus]